jgi:hypothetical protein
VSGRWSRYCSDSVGKIHWRITYLSCNLNPNHWNCVVYFPLPTHPASRRTSLSFPSNFDPDSNVT